MSVYKTIFLLLLIFISSSAKLFAKTDILPSYFNGITLENLDKLTKTDLQKLNEISTKTVVRVVFQKNTLPGRYSDNINELRKFTLPNSTERKFYILGLFLDSEALAKYHWEKTETDCVANENEAIQIHSYKQRINCYYDALDLLIDIWEVGNEVNGEWADEGCILTNKKGCKWIKDDDGKRISPAPIYPTFTAEKIKYAIDVVRKKDKERPIALTLIHQPECITWSDNTMIEWARLHLKSKLDGYLINYLLISYYEDNCDKGKKTIDKSKENEKKSEQERRSIYWNKTFNELAGLFANVQNLGFGEVGYSKEKWICEEGELEKCKRDSNLINKKIALMKMYYGLQINNQPKQKYIGGHFWWNSQEDIFYDAFYSSLKSQFKAI